MQDEVYRVYLYYFKEKQSKIVSKGTTSTQWPTSCLVQEKQKQTYCLVTV